MDLGRHDFGVLVTVQQDHVGFLHRAFQEFLAAQHLARQPLERLMNYCREQGPQRSWHEVTVFLFQMLSRADEVDKLVDLLRSEVADPLERPIQQILLTRLASSPINCTRRKAREVMAEAFGWIERGEWMPLRGSLVREAVHGLESAHVREMVAERMMRWFPGRLAFWHDFPKHSARKPNDGTVDDLLVALHNADSPFEYRIIAEGLALLRERSATLLDELRRVIRGPGEPGLAAAALHAFASGWPELPELGAMLLEGSVSPAEEIRRVAFLTRFNRGDRTVAVRDGLVSFCRDNAHLWPWEDDIIFALSTGWPKEPELMQAALGSFGQYGPGRWSPMLAIKYLLAGCAGEESVAQLVVAQLGLAENDRRDIQIFEERAALLLNYTRHPLVGPAAEAWLDRNAGSNHRPIEVAVCAQLAGTDKARQHLLDWLRRGDGMPAWIISTLQEMSVPDDAEVRAVLQAYMSDKQRRSGAVRFLPAAIASREELLLTLREILRDGDFWPWHDALELLVSLEGRDAPGLWESVEQRLKNDKGGHYWRLGHSLVIKIWPEHPLVRQLVIEHIYGEDVFISHFLEPYADDAEIRPLLDAVLRVLHPRLRGELVRALAPLARRGLPTAMAILAGFKNEPKDEARTIAARAFAKGRRRTGDRLAELADTLAKELGEWNFSHAERRQAAIAGLLELGRTDLIAAAREDGKKLRFETHASGGHNWEFIAAVVDHWEELAASMSDIWDRFGNSPAVAAELVNAGKIAAAAVQTASYEDQLRNGAQLDEDSVRALIALHGRSLFLRDLFLARFNRFMPTGGVNSIMTMEMQSYHLIGKYLAENFHGDPLVHDAMVQVANSILIHDAGWIALCRGWPNSPLFGPVVARLPTLIDAQEPVTAWIFSTKADAQQMAKYLLHYPSKLKRDHFGRPREGFAAIATRLQSDELCRQATFDGLKALSDIDVLVGVARLLGPTMRHDSEFRKWVLGQLQEARSKTSLLAPLALDILTNEHKTVECCLLDTVLTR
jgi:hypothetical protein